MWGRGAAIAGQLLWLVGCGTFFVSAVQADDAWAATGAVLFGVGVLCFLVPLLRRDPVRRDPLGGDPVGRDPVGGNHGIDDG